MERYVIPSVMQALQLCQAIAESRSGLSASEIESALKLPRTSVFRLLRTLTSERVVEKRGSLHDALPILKSVVQNTSMAHAFTKLAPLTRAADTFRESLHLRFRNL